MNDFTCQPKIITHVCYQALYMFVGYTPKLLHQRIYASLDRSEVTWLSTQYIWTCPSVSNFTEKSFVVVGIYMIQPNHSKLTWITIVQYIYNDISVYM